MHKLRGKCCPLYLSLHISFLEELKRGQKKFLGLFFGSGCNLDFVSSQMNVPVSLCKQQAIRMYRIESKYVMSGFPQPDKVMAVVKWMDREHFTMEEFAAQAGVDMNTAIAWFSSVAHCEENCNARACLCYRQCARGNEWI